MKFVPYAAISLVLVVMGVEANPTFNSTRGNNGCEDNKGRGDCDHKCQALTPKGSYRCSCREGFLLMLDGKTCEELKCDNGYFRCPNNGDCIFTSWLCDGEDDCTDGADEIECPSLQQKCYPNCENGGICNANLECECPPGWKGYACHLKDCNPKCENGGICNDNVECECPSGWKGNTCLIRDNYGCEANNGRGDCQDYCRDLTPKGSYICYCEEGYLLNADGKTCQELTCDNGYFRCPSNGDCIFDSWLCDGDEDCDDGADEKSCQNRIQEIECPRGEVISSQCLEFSTEMLSWDAANKRCESQNGHLATLDDPEAFHAYMIDEYGGEKFWIGGSDKSNEGEWLWLNGRPLALGVRFPWGRNQPDNNKGKQHCLGWGWKKRAFDDRSCSEVARFVCQH